MVQIQHILEWISCACCSIFYDLILDPELEKRDYFCLSEHLSIIMGEFHLSKNNMQKYLLNLENFWQMLTSQDMTIFSFNSYKYRVF